MNRVMLSQEEAQALCDALDIREDDGEEAEMLREQNPLLFNAYERLLKIADGQ